MSFSDKVCLVTGGGRGLGRAIAEAYLKAGALVSICDINSNCLENTLAEFSDRYLGRISGIVADVTDESAVQDVVSRTVSSFGHLDILINNAGIVDKWDPVGTLERVVWDRVIATNLTGPYLFSKLAVLQMLKQAAGGVIINIASPAAVKGSVGGAAYVSSKAGLVGLTKNTAAFYNKKNIRCVALIPGSMATPIVEETAKVPNLNKEGIARMREATTTERQVCDIDDVVQMILFYSTDSARVANGAIVTADGGWLAF